MSWVAVAVAAGSAISAGVSAMSSSAAGSKAAAASSQAAKSFQNSAKEGIGMIDKGEHSSVSMLTPYIGQLQDIAGTIGTTIAANQKQLPQAEQLSAQVDKFNQAELDRMLGKALPGYKVGVQQAQNNTLSMLRGEIPADVAAQVRRNTAQSALQGGFSGSESSQALTARDLGTTSLNLMQAGSNSEQSWISTARNQLMPALFNPATMFASPQLTQSGILGAAGIATTQANIINNDSLAKANQLIAGSNNATNAILGGQAAQIKADQASSQAIASGISGVAGAAAGYYMPKGGNTTTAAAAPTSIFSGSGTGASAVPSSIYSSWGAGPQPGTYYVPSTAAA